MAEFRGPEAGSPTCQILPPGIPGYRPYCPFTVGPTSVGDWVGPNLGLARRLVAESGTKGMRVVVWGHEWDRSISTSIVSVLRELGYRASVVIRPDAVYVAEVNNSVNQIQIGTS